MHILITDSGVGGLSICAYAEAFLRSNGVTEPTRLTYVNASAENDFGYNALGTRQEKLDHFDHFLHIVADKYAPDLIYVACNTLSVLLPETSFFAKGQIPVNGIVETGVNRLTHELDASPGRNIVIFGTVTTIEAQTYPAMLIKRGIQKQRITSQACPGLCDTISEDLSGRQAGMEIERYVRAALKKSQGKLETCLVYLACTHYGYRKNLFTAAFEKAGVQAEVLDPNEFAIDNLFSKSEPAFPEGTIEVEFVTRYRIPETALETISFFLGKVSPKTIHAFQNFTYAPDLFPGFRAPGQTS